MHKINDLNGFSISSTILGELFVGVYRVANKTKHLKKLNAFLEVCGDILLVDKITSELFGEISASLYRKGKPIASNDIWIAATAKQHKLTLITRDKHFNEIDGLNIENW